MMRPEHDRGAIISGLVFIAFGVLFLLDRLNVFTLRARFLWPIVLIALGVAVIARGSDSGRS